MGSEVPAPAESRHKKLSRLPKGTKIEKRPLLHPPIAAPRTGFSNTKVVYVKHSSPFISIVKRVRHYLKEIEKRSFASKTDIDLLGQGSDRQKLDRIAANWQDSGVGREPVVVKATGRAIQKALQIALHFRGQVDCVVGIRTASVGAIDDYEVEGEEKSRIRMTSAIEVLVRLKH